MESQRTILITGVTTGLGHALTHRMIAKGHILWGCGRSKHERTQLSLQYPAPHVFKQVDVSDWTQVSVWAQSLTQT